MGAKNTPTNPKLWSKAKSLAKSKFDVYPSAYANGWAAKWYKSKGGGWKSSKEESYTGSGLNYNKLTHYACTNCPHKWDTLNSMEGATTCWSCGHQGEDLGLVNEDLRKWFGKGKEGGHGGGGWDRYNSKGERIGKCAREPGEPKPKCLSKEKSAKMTKKEIAAAVKRKRRKDPVADRKSKGGSPIMSSNKIEESFSNLDIESRIYLINSVIDYSLYGLDPIEEISKKGVIKGILSIEKKLESVDSLDEALPKTRRQSAFPRKLSMLHPTVKRNLDKRAKEDKSKSNPYKKETPQKSSIKEPTKDNDTKKDSFPQTNKPLENSKPKPKVVFDKESKDEITVITKDDHENI